MTAACKMTVERRRQWHSGSLFCTFWPWYWNPIFEDHFLTDKTVHRVSSQFQEVKLMSCPTPKDSEEDCGISSSVPVLDPTSSSSILGGPSRHSSPSKPAFLCPSPPGSAAPNIYAKSTSPNCGISLQAEFFLSPLTTAVNYNPVARTWVTARRSDIETQRKEERGLKKCLEKVFVLHGRHDTYTHADLPRDGQALRTMRTGKWEQGWIVCVWAILSKVTPACSSQ